MRFLPGIGTKAASSSGAVLRSTGGIASQTVGGLLSSGSWDTEAAVKRGWERVIWVYRCVDAIASAQASVPIISRDENDKNKGKIVDDPQLYKLLNRRPNPYETAFQFRYRVSTMGLLSKRGVFIEKVKGPSGRIEQLHLLLSHQVEVVPDAKKFVKHFKVTTSSGETYELDPSQVIWIRFKPHPTDPYAQGTPLMAAGIAAETDYLARAFNRSFLANDGKPGMIIGLKGQVGAEDAQELKMRFGGGGVYGAGRTTVLEDIENIVIQDLSATPHDAQWLEACKAAKDDILLAFGVPESVMGNASGRTYDNADAEDEGFWKKTMVGHCDSIANAFDVLTEGGILDDIACAYDYDTVDVLQRMRKEREDRALAQYAAGAITWNELRAVLGRDEWDTALARIAILPNGFGIAKDGKDQAALTDMHALGTPAIDPQAQAQQVSASRQGALQGIAQANRANANDNAARALRLAKIAEIVNAETKAIESSPDVIDAEVVDEVVEVKSEIVVESHPYKDLRIELESEMVGVLGAWSRRQEQVVTERLKGVKTRKHTRHDTKAPGNRSLDTDYVVDAERWASDIRGDFEAFLGTKVRTVANRTKRALRLNHGINVAVTNDQIRDNLNVVLGMVETAARNQSDHVAKRIAQLDEQGKSMRYIETEVRRMIGTRASWRKLLATNATTALVEGIKTTVYEQLGNKVMRTWHTVHDERVRTTHAKADGSSVKGKGAYSVGKAKLRYPGDPSGPAEETINCRCHQSFEIM